MAKKQDLKTSEARILVYLAVADVQRRFVKAISNRLDMDYTYTLSLLGRMTSKGWLIREQGVLKSYYHIREANAPLELAKKKLVGGINEIKRKCKKD